MSPLLQRPLLVFTLLAALTALVPLAAVWVLQRRLIYFPIGVPPPVERALAGAREVTLATEDGLELGAWFLPGRGSAPWPAALVCNGNAGHRGDRVELARLLASSGMAVLLFDYRGYGGNPGRPNEVGLLHDGRAARLWLEASAEVDAKRVVLFGESLGAAVAVALAAERDPAAIVLRSPFTTLVDTGRLHYPWLPVRLLLADRFLSLDRIRAVEAPLLVLAGDRDRIVPQAMSRDLFEASPAELKRLVLVPEADHDTPALAAGPALREALPVFLESAGVVAGGGPPAPSGAEER